MNFFSFLQKKFYALPKVQFSQPVNNRQLFKNYFAIAWPAIIEGALLSLVGAVDTMMVGKVGYVAITSVGLTAQPRLIMLVLAQAICVGTTAVVARRKGENDQKGANACLHQSLLVVTGVGVLVTLVGYFAAVPFMRFAGGERETLELSVTYFRIITLGLTLNCWTLCICAALRAIGRTRITLMTNLAANLVNLCLNYCLIGGHLGFPALGVAGAAIATVCGTAVSAIIAFAVILRKNAYLRLRLRSLGRFDKRTLHGLVTIGSSSVAESVCMRLGFLINAKLIAELSTVAFACYQITNQFASISFCLGDGLASAAAVLVGQSLGAERPDLARANVAIGRRLSLISSLVLMVVFIAFRSQLAALYTDNLVVLAGVKMSLLVAAVGLIPQNGRVVYSGGLRGAGDVKYVAFVALISILLIRPVLTWALCYQLNNLVPFLRLAIVGAWVSFAFESLVRLMMLYHRIQKGKWLEVKL